MVPKHTIIDVLSAGLAGIGRRQFLSGVALAAVAAVADNRLLAAQSSPPGQAAPGQPAAPATVTIENFSPTGASQGMVQVPKIIKSEAEWHSQLSAVAFDVTRHAGTEMAFTGEYASNHSDGIYHCVCCDTALYDAKTKFESGTGWPSFWQPISPKNIVKLSDSTFGMQRDAISCRRCDAHLGHVFDDGPRPTGLRYCMNSASLHLTPRA